MLSPATSPTADPDRAAELDSAIATQRGIIAELERELWDGGLNEDVLDTYQAAYRRLERLLAEQEERGELSRHRFVIVIPVADRPQQLRDCLASLLELCESYGYGGQRDGVYHKVAVVIADDSSDPDSIARHRELAGEFTALGITTRHFAPDEQFALVEDLGEPARSGLTRVLGSRQRGGDGSYGHKGQAVMRNIAYLRLAAETAADERVLFYSIDSDQEFKVKVSTPDGDREACAVNFLHWLNEIFSRTEATVLTGKVVGDPPVSPAVMAGNFLEDVIGFLQQMAASGGHATCQHHHVDRHAQGEAAYHDMADLFGFRPASEAYRFLCPLAGEHGDADCFDHFASRLGSFFFGEHPTRVSYYQHASIARTVMAARTVYAGNYVFRPEALKYFIPFAALRLRMSGPTLGRLIRSEIDGRFVSANLPMLHKRTVGGSGQSEFRPGVRAHDGDSETVELCGEAERQFFGDVMLFTVERLTALGYPRQAVPDETLAATLAAVHDEMLAKYEAKRSDILAKLDRLRGVLHDPASWWNRAADHAAAVGKFAAFAANIDRNFGADSSCYERIESPQNWEKWRGELLEALVAYPADARLWAEAIAGRQRGA